MCVVEFNAFLILCNDLFEEIGGKIGFLTGFERIEKEFEVLNLKILVQKSTSEGFSVTKKRVQSCLGFTFRRSTL